MSLEGLVVSMFCITVFDGLLGGVTGVVYSVVFGVLSNFYYFHIRCNHGYDNFWQ